MQYECKYCNWLGKIRDFEFDHRIPLSRFGSGELANLRLICSGCNRQKGKMTEGEYVLWRILNSTIANFGPLRKK